MRYFRKRIFPSVLVAGIALLFAATVQGAYIGPDRSYTYSCNRRKACTYVANHPDETYNCTLTLYAGPNDNCQSAASTWPYFSVAGGCTHWTHNCSTAGECSVWSTGSSTQSCTIGQTGCVATTCSGTYSAATCTGSVTCASYGDNGWCSGSGSVTFNASEPISGEVITYIEGSYGSGDQTLCDPANAANVSCSWIPSIDGNFGLSFWAHSSWGDTSTMGSASLKIDTASPTMSFNLAGTNGDNGWWTTPVTVSVTGNDATSGIASTNLMVNSAPASSPATISIEGTNTVAGSVVDNAGWSSNTVSQTINIDTVSPTVSLSLSPVSPDGDSGWYITSPQATVTGSDATSGLASTGVRVDGGAAQASPVSVSDGSHSIVGEARDVAGNTSNTSSQTVKVDTIAPSADFVVSPTAPDGDNNWYVSWPTVEITGSDDGSGFYEIFLKMDGGAWESGPINISKDGLHVFDGMAKDVAGWTENITESVGVDTTAPVLSFTSHTDGDNVADSVTIKGAGLDTTSGMTIVEFSYDGTTWQSVSLSDGTWSYYWDASGLSDGNYTLSVRGYDAAGNYNETSIDVVLTRSLPQINISELWYIWQAGSLSVTEGGVPIASVKVMVSDPQGRWQSVVIYSSSKPGSKSQLTWDRLFGDGTVAPPGTYNVVATVADTMGRKVSDTGQIIVPEPSTTTPTAIPTEQDKPTTEPTTPANTPQPTVVAEVPLDEPPEEKEPVIVTEKDLKPFPWLLSLAFVSVALVGITRLYDPRPPALRKIADLFDDASAITQEINTTKNINNQYKK